MLANTGRHVAATCRQRCSRSYSFISSNKAARLFRAANDSLGSGSPSVQGVGETKTVSKDQTSTSMYDNDQRIAAALQAELDLQAAVKATEKDLDADLARDICVRQRRCIDEFLQRSCGAALYVESCEPNPAALPGTALYERFALPMPRLKTKPPTCVSCTPECNIQTVLAWLNPKRRTGQALGLGEYFGTDAAASLSYCCGGMRMIVLLCF